MEDSLDFGIIAAANDFLEKEERAAWTMVCRDHSDGYTLSSWYFKATFKFLRYDIFRIDSELLLNQIRSDFAAVYRSMTP
jgi:hypothetical protein